MQLSRRVCSLVALSVFSLLFFCVPFVCLAEEDKTLTQFDGFWAWEPKAPDDERMIYEQRFSSDPYSVSVVLSESGDVKSEDLLFFNKGCRSLKLEGNAVEVRNGKNIARRYELLGKDRMRLTYPLEQSVQDFQRIPAPQDELWDGKSSFSSALPKSWINDADGSILNISLDKGEVSLSGGKSEKILPERLLLSSALFAKSDVFFLFCNTEGPSSMVMDMQRIDETGIAKVRLNYKASQTEDIGSFRPISAGVAASVSEPGPLSSAPVPAPTTFSGRWVIDPAATRALLKEKGIFVDDAEATKRNLVEWGILQDDPEEYFQTLFDEFWWQFDFSASTLVERTTLDYFPAVPFTLEAKPGQLRMVYTSKVYGGTTAATLDILDDNTVVFNREVDLSWLNIFPLILVRDAQQNYSGEWKLRDVDALIQELSAAVDWKDLDKARQMLPELRLLLTFNERHRHAGSVEWKFLSEFPDFLHNGRCRVVPVGRNERKLIFNDGEDSYGLGGTVTLIFEGPDTIRYTPMWGFTAAEFIRVAK